MKKSSDIQRAITILDKIYFENLKKLIEKIDVEIFKQMYSLKIDTYNLITFLRLKKQNRTYKDAQFYLLDDEEILKIYENNNNYMSLLEKKYDNKYIWSEYTKTLKISTIEKIAENLLINKMKEYKNINYGIEPLITYIIAKEYEIKAIRLIMTAKINKIPVEIIKERLRDIYV